MYIVHVFNNTNPYAIEILLKLAQFHYKSKFSSIILIYGEIIEINEWFTSFSMEVKKNENK